MRQYRVCDSIDAYEFEKSLDKACTELDRVDGMSEAEACTYCNTCLLYTSPSPRDCS